MEKVEGKTEKDTEQRRKAVLNGYLYPNGEGGKPKGQFADPALMFL
jgi:hypothetical protein